MTRALMASPIGLIAFIAGLAMAALAARRGILTDDAVTLWASAISAGNGEVPLGRIVASYPTLPFLATTLIELVTPAGTPSPALLASGLLAILAGAWFIAFRSAGLPLAFAALASLLIALHPAMLAACFAGAAEMFVALFLYLLGIGLFDLRARTGAPEVMLVSLSLVGLAFSHPIGAAYVVAVTPGLILATRPALIANAALFLVLALVFPTLFAVGAFSYVSWVFPGSGWSFLAAPAESLAGWVADAAEVFRGLTGWLTLDAALLMASALVLGAPLAPVAIGWMRARRPLIAPPLVFASAVVLASAITVATGVFGNPASLAVATPVLAAVMVARAPVISERLPAVLALLVAGYVGGALGLILVEPRAAPRMAAAFGDRIGDQARLDALSLGGVIRGRDGVLIDTDNAPAVVIGRGRAKGLIAPSDAGFSLALLFSRLDAPFVAVPDPNVAAGVHDRINRAFPRLFRDGAPGYRLDHQNKTWRLYARQTNPGS